jgi:hypothetical protein
VSLPAGPAAQRKLAYYRRAKRRSKRDLSEFLRQGITPLAPFNFGATAAAGSSANTLTLPANGRFVLELDAIVVAADYGITDGITPIVNVDGGAASSRIEIRHYFRKDQGIQITRAVTCPAGTLNVYFQELGGKLTLIGTSTFS